MYWQKRFDRENPDKALEETILAIRESNKDYGYRRMVGELHNQGCKVNKKKVQRIMQKLGLQVTSFTRKSRKYSSYRGKVGTVAPNRIKRRFNTHIPHQKITTDTTELKYYEVDEKGHMTMHKLYLDPFMDMCNGEILSFGIDKHPSARNVMDALEQAIEITSDCPYRRTFHSDQGWAYQMKAYSQRLKQERIFQSMSRKGNCLDNSIMENFFGLLKQEIYYGVVYYSYEELKAEIERYIKYYNEQRIKEKLGWMSPVQYRLNLLAAYKQRSSHKTATLKSLTFGGHLSTILCSFLTSVIFNKKAPRNEMPHSSSSITVFNHSITFLSNSRISEGVFGLKIPAPTFHGCIFFFISSISGGYINILFPFYCIFFLNTILICS
jgi:transposase InsO family protein